MGIQKNLKMYDSSHVSQPSSSVNKFDMAQKFSMGSFGG